MATRTFLFVDQVGSTEKLTALGDAVAHERRAVLMGALRDAVAAHRGVEVDAAGDGLFAAFAGAAEAVEAAVSIQQIVEALGRREPAERRLAVRAGLHAGEPLTGGSGGYFGTAVVVASRLCSRAQAGQVLLSDTVRSLVEPRGEHVFTGVGALQLKGVPAPVATSALEWAPLDDERTLPPELAAPQGLAAEGRFVGRSPELARLHRALEEASSGRRRLVLLSGEAGAGATRTAAELARAAAAEGAVVWYGRPSTGDLATRQGGEGALGAWAQAVTTWASSVPRATARWALGGRGGDLRVLSPVAAELAPSRASSATSAGAAPFVVADALDDLLGRLSTWAPVVVILDHLEDADPGTLAVLERLARSARRGRVLFVASHATSAAGTSQVVAALSSVPDVVDVVLGPLSSAEVSQLVASVTGATPSEATVRAVRSESEGLPFFVRQMALVHRERDVRGTVARAVDRTEDLRTELRLSREEVSLGLRELEQLRVAAVPDIPTVVEPDGTPPADVRCPYRGLLAFGADDAEWFAGRDPLVAELVARLAASRFVAVVGPSGSGKSSAVLAGLLPALARGDVAGAQEWVPAVLTPGTDPVSALAAALAGLAAEGDAAGFASRLSSETLGVVAAEAAGGRTVVVVVDQAEELWTSSGAESRDRAVDLLTGAADDPAAPVVVVLAMRADYYGRAAAHPALAGLVTDSQVLVGPMDDAGLRVAVEAPARRAGLVLEPGLAQAVVDDAGRQPGSLPLVSTALLETWQRRRGRSLSLSGYAEAGGVRRAIARLADDTYEALDDSDQDAARRLLLRLAAPGVDGDDVARRASLAEVAGDHAARMVLGRLAAARLVVVGGTSVAVAHEALLREWPRLRTWLDADREGRRLHQQVASAAVDWDAAERGDDHLLRGARLAAASDLRGTHDDALTELERTFIDASEAGRRRELDAARRTNRRLRVLAAGLAAVLVAALGVSVVAVRQRADAAARALAAEAEALAARAEDLASDDVGTALLLAVEAHRRSPSLVTRSALLTTLDAARYVREQRPLPDPPVSYALATALSAPLVGVREGDAGSTLVLLDAQALTPVGDSIAEDASVSWTGGSPLGIVDAEGARLVDGATGAVVGRAIPGEFDFAAGVRADGSRLALTSVSAPSRVSIYDTATGQRLAEVDVGEEFPIVEGRATADEVLITTSEVPPTTRRYRWDGTVASPPIVHEGLTEGIVTAASSPDGASLALSTFTGELRLVDISTGSVRAVVQPSAGQRLEGRWSLDSARYAVLNQDGSIEVVAATDGRVETVVRGLGTTTGMTFTDEGTLLVFGDGVVTTVDPDATTALGKSVTGPPATAAARRSDDSALVAMDQERLSTLSLSEGRESSSVPLSGLVYGLDVTRDGALAVVHSGPPEVESSEQDPERLTLVDLDAGVIRGAVDLGLGDTSYDTGYAVLSPDDRQVAVKTADEALQIYAVPSLEPIGRPVTAPERLLVNPVWTSDGETLIIADESAVRAVAARDGEVLWEQVVATQFLTALTATADGGRVVVGDSSGQVTVLDGTADGRPVASLDAGPAPVSDVAVVAGSTTGDVLGVEHVLALSDEGRLWVWDASTGTQVGPALVSHQGIADAFIDDVDADGRMTSVGSDGSIITWPVRPAGWAERACDLAGRDLTHEQWERYLPDEPYRRTCVGGG